MRRFLFNTGLVREFDRSQSLRLRYWRIRLNRCIGRRTRLDPATDAGGDRFLRRNLLLPDALRRGFDAVRRLECLDLLGQFSGAGLCVAARLGCFAGKAGFELVAQVGEFSEIGVVQERDAEPCLVIPQLRLGNGEFLPDAVAFAAVAAGHTLQGV